jgi:hypothetical protein
MDRHRQGTREQQKACEIPNLQSHAFTLCF